MDSRRHFALFGQLDLALDGYELEDVAVVGAGVVQEVVCLFAFLPAFHLVEGVVAHMLDLDGAVDCSSIALRKASFFSSALFADDFVFEVIRDALLSL